jgi:hypothetical protein
MIERELRGWDRGFRQGLFDHAAKFITVESLEQVASQPCADSLRDRIEFGV